VLTAGGAGRDDRLRAGSGYRCAGGRLSRPREARPSGGSDDFLKGLLAGAGLVVLGVVVGGVFGRRR
jgi:hypothetical protein